ncbi:hypothetical protein [Hellea balneolensis]|uniref:hypothetical protein n=1 Tax=Hellea balneolensis TaxID=287478 RepID=UPI0004218E4D|nr:hypothetical protein [Hellea balneolensis]
MTQATPIKKTSRIKNTLEGREKGTGLAALMTPKMIFSLVIIGIFSFAALVTLSGYAGDLREKNNGQAHALSRSAIGFGGLTRLLGDMDYDIRMARTENVQYADSSALRVFTMSRPFQADGLDELELYAPTLIIMPKWITAPVKGSAGWVQKGWGEQHVWDDNNHERDLKELAGEIDFTIIETDDKSVTYTARSTVGDKAILRDIEIENLQWLKGEKLLDIIRVEEGPVLVKIQDTTTYILSDPDFLNTMGIASKSRARFAVDIIEAVISDAEADPNRVDFDLTFHGFGGKTNVIKVLTQPPFLAATLCLLAAGGLIAWQAFSRFGDPLEVRRDYALGKFSLADNAARFIRIAGREPNMASDYVKLIRKQVIKELDLNGRRVQDIDTILARKETMLSLPNTYTDLQNRAGVTTDNLGLMQLAEDLNHWKNIMTRTTSHKQGESS